MLKAHPVYNEALGGFELRNAELENSLNVCPMRSTFTRIIVNFIVFLLKQTIDAYVVRLHYRTFDKNVYNCI